jgi:hypothetical protein
MERFHVSLRESVCALGESEELMMCVIRWSSESRMHPPNQNDRLETRTKEHHGKCHLPWRLSLTHDKLWSREVQRRTGIWAANRPRRQAERLWWIVFVPGEFGGRAYDGQRD